MMRAKCIDYGHPGQAVAPKRERAAGILRTLDRVRQIPDSLGLASASGMTGNLNQERAAAQ